MSEQTHYETGEPEGVDSSRFSGFSNHSIQARHRQEFRSSGIRDSIAVLNFISTADNTLIRYWLNWQSEHRRRICPFESGWYCDTLDPQTGIPRSWGPFKPDQPRLDANSKIRKYEHPTGYPTLALFLNVDITAWWAIAEHYQIPTHLKLRSDGIPETETNDGQKLTFWPWVLEHPQIEVIITEGAKKAACLLSQGLVAIGLPGIWNGRRKGSDSTPAHLISDLQAFAQPGRPIQFCFDYETKPKTRRAVQLATWKTGQLFAEAGCRVTVISLPGPEKGVDDFMAAQGRSAFDLAQAKAQPLTHWHWQIHHQRQQTHPISESVQQAQLQITPSIRSLDQSIIAIRSAKGTGKTLLLGHMVANTRNVLVLTHRICLGRNLCGRINVDWRSDLDQASGLNADHGTHRWIAEGNRSTSRIGLCIDSLMAIDFRDFEGADLVIDEVDQVLRHLLLSSTTNQGGKRPALLARFQELIKVAGRVIVASADITDAEIKYLQTLRGQPSSVHLLHNSFQPQGYPIQVVDSAQPEDLINRILAAVTAGQKCFVTTDGLSRCKAIHALIEDLRRHHPDLRVMVINSETSGGPEEVEFVRNINQRVQSVDVLITTPSLATGVSIEVDHFDLCFGLFTGVLTDAGIAQALGRVRPPIPRIIWTRSVGSNFSKVSRSTSAPQVKAALTQQWDRETSLIRISLNPDLSPLIEPIQDWTHNPHIDLWSTYTALTNASMSSLRDQVLARLSYEGHSIEIISPTSAQSDRDHLKAAQQETRQAHYRAVANARSLSRSEIQSLQSQEHRSPTDHLNEIKTRLCEFYKLEEITPELVELDQGGKLRGQILELESLLYGSTYATARDLDAMNRQTQWRAGIFIPDQPCYELRRFVREQLGLLDYLDPDQEWKNSDLEALGNRVRQFRTDVKKHLNLTIPTDPAHANNIWILRHMFRQLGISIKIRYQGSRGHQVKVYRIDPERWSFLMSILERRQQSSEAQSVSPPPEKVNIQEGGHTPTLSSPDPNLEFTDPQAPQPHQPTPAPTSFNLPQPLPQDLLSPEDPFSPEDPQQEPESIPPSPPSERQQQSSSDLTRSKQQDLTQVFFHRQLQLQGLIHDPLSVSSSPDPVCLDPSDSDPHTSEKSHKRVQSIFRELSSTPRTQSPDNPSLIRHTTQPVINPLSEGSEPDSDAAADPIIPSEASPVWHPPVLRGGCRDP